MKHINLPYCLLTATLAMISAGCTTPLPLRSKSTSSVPTNIESVSPTSQYLTALNMANAKCGSGVHLVYLVSLNNKYLNQQRTDSYFFTAGVCGPADDLIVVDSDYDTGVTGLDTTTETNPGGILRPLPLAELNIDYDQAVGIASETIRSTFLRQNPTAAIANVTLSFRQNQSFHWAIVFKSPGGQSIVVSVAPDTGLASENSEPGNPENAAP
jgi:hypothetical protein